MSDDVIDLGEYARRREKESSDRTTFAVWGGEGERARFALPLWRAVFLAGGTRGGLIWSSRDDPEPRPFVVLDLSRDPARLEYASRLVESDERDGAEAPLAPVLEEREESVVVFLGDHDDRRWHLVVDGVSGRREPLDRRVREDILFLSGECAGLLFYRDFAQGATSPPDPDED